MQVTGRSAAARSTRAAPLISHNVTAEEIDRLPKARSFQCSPLTAPSVNSGEIEGGFQVNGASGAENAFTVDGVVTNSLINGSSRQNTVFEYLQEVQVKTDRHRGRVRRRARRRHQRRHQVGRQHLPRRERTTTSRAAPLSAGPVKRLVLNPSDDVTVSYVQDEKQPDHRNEFGGSLGGPIVKDKLFFFGSFSPRVHPPRRTTTSSPAAPRPGRSSASRT